MNGRPRYRPLSAGQTGPMRSQPDPVTEALAGLSAPVRDYAVKLALTGMEPREVARAAIYAERYGLEALNGPGCVTFDVPSCANENCLNPEHQRVSK